MTGHYLDVGAGQQVWWAELGNPEGLPVVVLHGGPGSGTSPAYLSWCDPDSQRIVLMDQRNSGRSTPHASTVSIDLSSNTTANLIVDLERLRELLGIDRWMVIAASWGTTLALAYGQQHPEAISGMVLVSTVTTSSAEVDWITRGMGAHFPDQWSRFIEALPADMRDGNVAAAYHALLMDADPKVHEPAARAWCAWEETHVATDGRPATDPRYGDPRFRLCFARIVTRYWANHCIPR